MKYSSCCIIALFIFTAVYSQEKSQSFGVKMEGGASIIKTNYNELQDNDPTIDPAILSFKDQWSPSYNFGFYYTNQFTKKSELSVEFKFSQILSTIVYKDDFQSQYGNNEYRTKLRVSYLSIPIYYGFKISKFSPNIGFRLSLLISDRIINYGSSQKVENHEAMETDKMDFGPQIGFTYNLSEKLAIETVYYHGINNLVNWENPPYVEPDLAMRSRQFTLGVKYNLFSK